MALATLLRFALIPLVGLTVPFIIYFPAVVLCAWFGGLWPGLLSTALSGAIAWYVFIAPQFSFRVFDHTASAQLIVFLLAGTLISFLAENLHRVEQQRVALLESEKAARERAEAASRAKDEFVAVVSHEIRGPLTAILGWIQLLRRGHFSETEMVQALEHLERNAKVQAELVEDLLDISRAITGKLILDVRPVELGQIVRNAVESLRTAVDAKSIDLNVQLDPRGVWVSGDPNRLQQIVWNLISNAVKFTPGKGSVAVRVEGKASLAHIVVSDRGIGIRPDFLPKVFDRFSQAPTAAASKHAGLGLGLSIVKHLVELHGGTVHAESDGEGLGATFTVTLPRIAAQD